MRPHTCTARAEHPGGTDRPEKEKPVRRREVPLKASGSSNPIVDTTAHSGLFSKEARCPARSFRLRRSKFARPNGSSTNECLVPGSGRRLPCKPQGYSAHKALPPMPKRAGNVAFHRLCAQHFWRPSPDRTRQRQGGDRPPSACHRTTSCSKKFAFPAVVLANGPSCTASQVHTTPGSLSHTHQIVFRLLRLGKQRHCL